MGAPGGVSEVGTACVKGLERPGTSMACIHRDMSGCVRAAEGRRGVRLG
jgi:hypothetical protein